MLLGAIHHMKMIFILQYTIICPKVLKTPWIKHIEKGDSTILKNQLQNIFSIRKKLK